MHLIGYEGKRSRHILMYYGPGVYLQGIRQMKYLKMCTLSSGGDMNSGPPEHKTGVLLAIHHL